jgi:hypothetical protein
VVLLGIRGRHGRRGALHCTALDDRDVIARSA